jgi:ribosomal protein L7/L12
MNVGYANSRRIFTSPNRSNMTQPLKFLIAGSLIGLGVVLSGLALMALLLPGQTVDQRTGAIGTLLIFGLPPIVMGGALWYLAQQGDQAREAARQRNAFFYLVQQGKGQITVLDFAIAAKLDGDRAKAYLDDRAREFNANFDVSAAGGVVYCFDTALSGAIALPIGQPQYDVILQDYPGRQRQAVETAILRLTDLPELRVREVTQQAKKRPVAIANGVSQVVAEDLRERLEGLGATVLVILQ